MRRDDSKGLGEAFSSAHTGERLEREGVRGTLERRHSLKPYVPMGRVPPQGTPTEWAQSREKEAKAQ